jgi:hypothetical protein
MPNGNKTDNGVLEIGTDEIVSSFKEDTPGENVKEYLAQARLSNEEKKSERKKNFSQVFDNPLKGFPYNEEIEVTPIKEGNMQVEGDPYVPQKKGVNKNIANYWNKEIKGLTPKELEAIQSMYMITDHSGVVQMYKAGKRDFIKSIKEEVVLEDYKKVIKMYPSDNDWKKLITKHKRAIDDFRKNNKDLPSKVEDELLGWASQTGEVSGKHDAEDFIMSILDESTISENYRVLAKHGMGAETKNSIKVGTEVDYYQKDGAKYMGKITKMTPKGYIVRDDKTKKDHEFTYHDRNAAKKLLKMSEEAHPCQGLSEDDPCWKDYKQVGMKKKNGKEVPNCVPKEDVEEGAMDGQKMTGQEISTYFRKNPVRDKDLKKAVEIALDHSGAMTYAINKIEKLKKGLSKKTEVKKALQYANEEVKYKLNVGVVFTEDKKVDLPEMVNINKLRELPDTVQKQIMSAKKEYDTAWSGVFVPMGDEGTSQRKFYEKQGQKFKDASKRYKALLTKHKVMAEEYNNMENIMTEESMGDKIGKLFKTKDKKEIDGIANLMNMTDVKVLQSMQKQNPKGFKKMTAKMGELPAMEEVKPDEPLKGKYPFQKKFSVESTFREMFETDLQEEMITYRVKGMQKPEEDKFNRSAKMMGLKITMDKGSKDTVIVMSGTKKKLRDFDAVARGKSSYGDPSTITHFDEK